MSRDKFDDILQHISIYFPQLHVAGKAPIPIKYLLAGTLRWVALLVGVHMTSILLLRSLSRKQLQREKT
jgi:hypothetical protein